MGRTISILLALVVVVATVFTHRATQNLSRMVEDGLRDIPSQKTTPRQFSEATEPQRVQVDQSTTDSGVDYDAIREIIQDVVDAAMSDYSSRRQLVNNQHPDANHVGYDPVVVRAMKSRADAALEAAVEVGIWSQESADAFYTAIERLPEDERFEFYVKHSAALNSGKLMLPAGGEPSLLLR